MKRLAVRYLLSSMVVSGVLGHAMAARATCSGPPAPPTDCFCLQWSRLDVVYLGHREVEELPPSRYVERLRVEEVFAAEDAVPAYAVGDAVPLRDDDASFLHYDEHRLTVDEERSLAWSPNGGVDYWREPVLGAGMTSFGDPFGARTDETCVISVAPEALAEALVAPHCEVTLRELAPQVPARAPYFCDDNPSACGAGGPASPRGLAVALLLALAVLTRRRRRGTA